MADVSVRNWQDLPKAVFTDNPLGKIALEAWSLICDYVVQSTTHGGTEMKLFLDLTDSQNEKLDSTARRLGIRPEELAKAALDELLDKLQEDFETAAQRVLSKNEELYRRLS